LLLGIMVLPAVVRAHDLWLERAAGGLTLRYGHRGGVLLALDADKVKRLRCRSLEGGGVSELRGEAVVRAKALLLPRVCAAASAFLDGGTWSLTPDGEKNLPKRRVADAVKAWESRQYAKWLDPRAPGAMEPLGDVFEIVPVTALSDVHQGDKATFRVLLQGKAVEGATIAIDHKPLGQTDRAGEVRIRIRAAEVESLSVSFKRSISSPDADVQAWEASLTFEVAQ
jgi:nickel transport protein